MWQSLIIIDDFLNDPYALREAALQQEYPPYDKLPPFPGRNSKYRQIINGFDEKIAEIIGEKLIPTEGTSFGKFRLALEGEKGTHSVHIDNAHWTAILFLTLPEDCQDGTHLFRHKASGMDRAPIKKEEFELFGVTDPQVFLDDVLYKHSNDMIQWEKLFTIPMRFNRMILMRPQQFHDAGLSFGTTPENGRLVYLSFYNNAETTRFQE